MHDRYFFDATTGQSASLSISSDGDVAGFTLVSPDGRPLKTLSSEATSGTFTLPTTGAYVVGIGSPTQGVAYTLTLSIL